MILRNAVRFAHRRATRSPPYSAAPRSRTSTLNNKPSNNTTHDSSTSYTRPMRLGAMFWPMMQEARERVIIFLQSGCLVLCINKYGGQLTICQGPSMWPTLNPSGDLVVTEMITHGAWWQQWWGSSPQKGEVVIACAPVGSRRIVAKRILAMEGERVRVNSNDGIERVVEIPQGHVWLQGDNTKNSTDSRDYGPVPLAMVISRVLFRVAPFAQFGRLGTVEYERFLVSDA